MDPLSVAMSIVGLVQAGKQISATLTPIIKKAINAPKEIKDIKSSVDAIRAALSQLQLMLLGQSQVSRHRTSLILVEQIVITLSACVTTFSDLDVFVESLGDDSNMGLLDRMRWATKTSTIKEHLDKLEVHKSTLTLMMTILTCDSARTAEDAVDVLSMTIQRLLESNILIAQRLASIEVGLGVTTEVEPFAEFEVLNQGSAPTQRNAGGFAFEEELSLSWVYKRSAVRDDNGAFSVITSAGRTASWSMLSGLSLADNISVIAVQALPIYEQDLSNSDLYKFGDFTEKPNITGSPIEKPKQPVVTSPGKRGLRSWLRRAKPRSTDNSEPDEILGVFGIPLKQSITYANVAISLVGEDGRSYIYGYVPIVVAKVCVWLKEKGTDCEDIFARSGSATRVHELEIVFDSSERYGKGFKWDGYTVHDAASCLLRYLKRLPEPVIPFTFYDKFTSIDFIQNAEASDPVEDCQEPEPAKLEAISALQGYITELPPLSRQLLLYILDTVSVFAAKSDINKMTAPRLVAAFQPSLLARDPSLGMSADDHHRAATVIKFLIENEDYFFIGMLGGGAKGESEEGKAEGGSTEEGKTEDSNPEEGALRELEPDAEKAMNFRNLQNIYKEERLQSKQPAVKASTATLARSNSVPTKRTADLATQEPNLNQTVD